MMTIPEPPEPPGFGGALDVALPPPPPILAEPVTSIEGTVSSGELTSTPAVVFDCIVLTFIVLIISFLSIYEEYG